MKENKTLEEIENRFEKKLPFTRDLASSVGRQSVKDFFGKEFETYFQKRLKEVLPEKRYYPDHPCPTLQNNEVCKWNLEEGFNRCIDEILNRG